MNDYDDEQAVWACAPIPAADEPFATRLDKPLEIRTLLKQFALSAQPLTLHAGSAMQPVIGRVLRLDPQAGTFHFGCQPDGEPAADRKLFVTSHGGAKLQFAIDEPILPVSTARGGYVVPFPLQILRLQRREFNRLEVPLGRSFVASFALDGRDYQIHLYDLSLGGVGLRTAPHDAEALYVGRVLRQVQVQFGSVGVFVTDLEIRLRRAFNSGLLGEQIHIGCRMLNLSPASKARLRSMLTSLEREQASS